jgi:hypothetical protein
MIMFKTLFGKKASAQEVSIPKGRIVGWKLTADHIYDSRLNYEGTFHTLDALDTRKKDLVNAFPRVFFNFQTEAIYK